MATVFGIVNKHGLAIETRHKIQPNKISYTV